MYVSCKHFSNIPIEIVNDIQETFLNVIATVIKYVTYLYQNNPQVIMKKFRKNFNHKKKGYVGNFLNIKDSYAKFGVC